MALRERFLDLLQAADITYNDLAKLSGVSAATISRIVNGASGNTENLESLIGVLEGLADETAPNTPAPPDPVAPPTICTQCRATFTAHLADIQNANEKREQVIREHYERLLAEKDQSHAREVDLHERAKTYLKQRHLRASIGLWALVAIIVIILVIDVSHGTVGWIRYANTINNHGAINEIIQYLTGWLT